MKLSVIILNHNTPRLVKYLLDNIEVQKPTFDYELIIIDNGPRHGLRDLIKEKIPYLKYKAVPNKGYSAGNNQGLKEATGEYVLIVNPDIYFLPDTFQRLVEYMDAQPAIGMLGPKLIYPSGEYQYSCLRYPDWRLPFYRRSFLGRTKAGERWLRHYLMQDYDHMTPRSVNWLFGACLLVRRQALEEVGLLDENFFMYFEDLDWCRRFWQKGWEVHYYPKVEVIHFHHRDSADRQGLKGLLTKLGRVHLVSWFKYMLKYKNYERFDGRGSRNDD
ncbi:MAG: glycosyltransferase family 2 protein [Candidatus Komeilibacteria bacterium]|nr:glycosyltransferase family 2 protein [Candidatus Komeilibacteria bacterium]